MKGKIKCSAGKQCTLGNCPIMRGREMAIRCEVNRDFQEIRVNEEIQKLKKAFNFGAGIGKNMGILSKGR